MQIVIDIPEKIYDAVNNESVCGYMHYKNIWKYGNLRFNVGQAIKDGTLLEDIKAEIPILSHWQTDDGQDLLMVADALECIDRHTGKEDKWKHI